MFLVILIFIFFTNASAQEDCILDISRPNSPFILDQDFRFPVQTEKATLQFKSNAIFYVECPKGTSSSLIADDGETVACKGGTNLLNIGSVEIIDFTNIECKKAPITTVRKLNQTCENNGTLIDIGFQVQDTFVSAITVCFDDVKLTPFYCKFYKTIEIVGVTSGDDYYTQYVCNSKTGCNFVDGGSVYKNIDMDTIYDKTKQDEILQNLEVSDDIINSEEYLMRGQLALEPLLSQVDELFIQEVLLYPSFDYINIIPIWSKFYAAWFDLFTVIVEDHSSSIYYTGALDVAKVGKKDGDSTELYLSVDQIPVPKWIWNVVDNSLGIGFYFFYNNPFTNASLIQEEWLSEICGKGGLTGKYGYCDVDQVIHPKLQDFIKNNLM